MKRECRSRVWEFWNKFQRSTPIGSLEVGESRNGQSWRTRIRAPQNIGGRTGLSGYLLAGKEEEGGKKRESGGQGFGAQDGPSFGAAERPPLPALIGCRQNTLTLDDFCNLNSHHHLYDTTTDTVCALPLMVTRPSDTLP